MSPNKPLVLSLALVAGVNLFVLGGVAYNRSGREASLALTEREFTLETVDKENTSISLSLDIYGLGNLPPKKLRELGYNLDRPSKKEWHNFPTRKVYAALEYAGPAWQKWLADEDRSIAKEQKLLQTARKGDAEGIQDEIENMENSRETQSHLFPVDVALDPAALRAAYPDRAKVAIVQGLLEVTTYEQDKKQVYNTTFRLLNGEIHVDQAYRPLFLGLKDTNKHFWNHRSLKEKTAPYYQGVRKPLEHWYPRYQVTLDFGKRLEPSLIDCELLPAPTPPENKK